MSNEQTHRAQFERNRAAVHALRALRHEDPSAEWARQWEVVASFYAAVHWVECSFAVHDKHGSTHRGRLHLAGQLWPSEREPRRAFEDLWHLSERVRYGARLPNDEELRAVSDGLALIVERLW